MNKIKAIIVDDELKARENLRYLIKDYCPNLEIISEVSNVDDAIIAINEHAPNVVFLDIEMPQKNGFQLLEAFNKINFQVVFVTAYDTYAIKAFEVAALDYLLKPIDINRLKEVAQKINTIIVQESDKRLQLLKENKKVLKKIAIPYKRDYIILAINDIICIEADRMYSILYLKNKKKYVTAKSLSYYQSLLSENNQFVRTHRSWVINTNYDISYSKSKKILLIEGFEIPISKSYKEGFEAIYLT